MKCVTLICLLICFSLIESRNLFKRDADEVDTSLIMLNAIKPDTNRHIDDVFNTLQEKNFRGVVLVMVSQNLQKCSLEELTKLVDQIDEFAKSCVANDKSPECEKPLATILFDKICAAPDLNTKYDFSAECCGKPDPERGQCFRDHRGDAHIPVKDPEPEEICKEYKEHPEHILAHYIHEVSRGHPVLFSPAVLGLTQQFNIILTECCEADNKKTCFKNRMKELHRMTHAIEAQHRSTCEILDNFKTRALQAVNLVRVSQRYPKASFERVQKIVHEFTHFNEDCCHGNTVECLVERLEFTQHICENHEELSTKLHNCCEKPFLERSYCIVNLENDDVPADLSLHVTEYIEHPKVCEHYAEKKDVFLASFLYEYSRRHPELSIELLLRIARGYEDLLNKCCKTDNPPECYKDAKEILANGIQQSKRLLEQNCAAQQKLGDYPFQNVLLIRYTRKMPQVTADTMIEITDKMTKVGAKCCGLPEKQRMSCSEGGLSLIIGQMCERQKRTFINNNVAHCCNESYSGRRPCFTDLGVDESYVPPALDEDTFHFGEDLCTAPIEKLPKMKQRFLIKLLQLKPHLEHEKITEIIAEFTKMLEKCCSSADHQDCFDTEKPILIAHCQQLIA